VIKEDSRWLRDDTVHGREGGASCDNLIQREVGRLRLIVHGCFWHRDAMLAPKGTASGTGEK
jgi:G:T-mismatch repair DNA endonuclease (very short patch repair protein)